MTSVRIVDPERARPLTKVGLTIGWLLRSLASKEVSRFPSAFQTLTVPATILLAKWSPVGTWDVTLEDTFVAAPGKSASPVKYTSMGGPDNLHFRPAKFRLTNLRYAQFLH